MTQRTISLDQALRNFTGGDHPQTAVAEERCLHPPIGCGKKLNFTVNEEFPFRDRPSFNEWRITGLCQACQDRMEDA